MPSSGRASPSHVPSPNFLTIGASKVGPEEEPFHIDPFIKMFHGNTGFQTEPVEVHGNGGKDVYFAKNNDFLFRSDEKDQQIRFEVWEDDVGFLCECRVDKTKFIKNPDQQFNEIVTMKDDQGWAAGTMRFDIVYQEKTGKFDVKVKSVIGLTIDVGSPLTKPGVKMVILSLCTVIAYMVASVVFYMYAENVLFQDTTEASFVDALYFTVATFTTIGYGDITPISSEGKWFTIFFSMLGLMVVVFFVGTLGAYASEANASAEIAKRQELEDKMRKVEDGDAEPDTTSHSLKACKNYSFILLELLRDFCLLLCMVSIGALAYYLENEADFVDCLYFSVSTSTTIGYGDLTLQTEGGRVFAIFFMPLTVLVLLQLVGDVLAVPSKMKRMRMESDVMLKFGGTLDPEEFAMLTNSGKHPQYITRDEFVFSMLLRLKKVSQHDVDRCARLFDVLDHDRNGVLTAADISPTSNDPLQRARTAATSIPSGMGGPSSKLGNGKLVKPMSDNDSLDTARSTRSTRSLSLARGSRSARGGNNDMPPLSIADREQGVDGHDPGGRNTPPPQSKAGRAPRA